MSDIITKQTDFLAGWTKALKIVIIISSFIIFMFTSCAIATRQYWKSEKFRLIIINELNAFFFRNDLELEIGSTKGRGILGANFYKINLYKKKSAQKNFNFSAANHIKLLSIDKVLFNPTISSWRTLKLIWFIHFTGVSHMVLAYKIDLWELFISKWNDTIQGHHVGEWRLSINHVPIIYPLTLFFYDSIKTTFQFLRYLTGSLSGKINLQHLPPYTYDSITADASLKIKDLQLNNLNIKFQGKKISDIKFEDFKISLTSKQAGIQLLNTLILDTSYGILNFYGKLDFDNQINSPRTRFINKFGLNPDKLRKSPYFQLKFWAKSPNLFTSLIRKYFKCSNIIENKLFIYGLKNYFHCKNI